MPTIPAHEKCWNCRRGRLRCDAKRPRCQKCIKNGVECLGYGQVLKWVGGMATRGNLTDERFRETVGMMHAKSSETRRPHETAENSTALIPVSPRAGCASLWRSVLPLLQPQDASSNLVILRPIVEPGLQDMSYNERFFVHYYEHRLCPALSLWHSDKNPYKAVIPLFGSSKAILTTAIATAICHYANSTMKKPLVTFTEENSEYTCNAKAISFETPVNSASAHLLETYYTLKQKSLRLLAQAMEDPRSRADMSTLVTTILLLVLEFLETGFKTWSIHLEGAKRLIEVVSSSGQLDVNNELDGIADGIIEADTFGGTFMRPGILTRRPALQSALEQDRETLSGSFCGCPVKIMLAIDFVSSQRSAGTMIGKVDVKHDVAPPDILGIRQTQFNIDQFDVRDWALKTGIHYTSGTPEAFKKLVQIGSIWKTASSLYAHRVLRALTGETEWQPVTVEQLMTEITAIDSEPAIVKCLTWPTFIAGAESHKQEHRDWALRMLDRVWRNLFSANVKNAACVLTILWNKQDSLRTQGDLDVAAAFDWITELSNQDERWMFL